jgi:hypothetical protein
MESAQMPGEPVNAPTPPGEIAGVAGPSPVARHAADMVAILDHLRLDAELIAEALGGEEKP